MCSAEGTAVGEMENTKQINIDYHPCEPFTYFCVGVLHNKAEVGYN